MGREILTRVFGGLGLFVANFLLRLLGIIPQTFALVTVLRSSRSLLASIIAIFRSRLLVGPSLKNWRSMSNLLLIPGIKLQIISRIFFNHDVVVAHLLGCLLIMTHLLFVDKVSRRSLILQNIFLS